MQEVAFKVIIDTASATPRFKQLQDDIRRTQQLRDEAARQGNNADQAAHDKRLQRLQAEERAETSRIDRLRQTLQHLDQATPRALRAALRELNAQLNSGQVERGSQEWDQLTAAISRTRQELRDINATTSATASSSSGLVDTLRSSWAGLALGVGAAVAAVGRLRSALEGYVQDYARMDEAYNEVEKYTGLARSQVKELNQAFSQFDTRTTTQQLNQLAADAGRLGIQGKAQILDFVTAADQLNTALGADLGENAIKDIGKLAQLFGDDQRMGLKQAMLSTGSAINELAQSSSASESYIVDFTARLAGVGAQAGFTQAQIMGYAATLDTAMVGQEKGATALQNVITALYRKPAEFARLAGLQVGEFTRLLRTDANAALLQFVGALRDAGSLDKIAPMLDEMKLSGAGVTQTLAALSGNLDRLRSAQTQATQAFALGTSVTQEAAKANSTLQAQIEKAENRLMLLRAELGERLAPAFLYLTNTGVSFLEFLGRAARFAFENRTAVVALGLATASLTALLISERAALTGRAIAAELSRLATMRTLVAERASLLLTTLQTAALNVYKIAVLAAIVVKERLTGSTLRAAAAQRLLSATLAATPWGAVLSVVGLVVGAIALLATRSKEAVSAMTRQAAAARLLADAQSRAAQLSQDEATRLRQLLSIANDHTASLTDRRNAIAQLNKIVPQYNGFISATGRIERQNRQAVYDYISALSDKATAEALYQKKVEIARNRVGKQLELQRINVSVEKSGQAYKQAQAQNTQPLAAFGTAGYTSSATDAYTDRKRRENQTHRQRQSQKQQELRELDQQDRALDSLLSSPRYKKHAQHAALAAAAPSFSPTESNSSPAAAAAPRTASTKTHATPAHSSPAKEKDDSPTALDMQRAALRAQYETQKLSYQQYNDALLQLEVDHYDRLRQNAKAGTRAALEAEKDYYDARRRQAEAYHAYSLRQIEADQAQALHRLEMARSTQQFQADAQAQGITAAELYERRRYDIQQQAAARRIQDARTRNLPQVLDRLQAEQQQAIVQEQQRRELAQQQALQKIREQFHAQSAAERYSHELATLEALHREQLLAEDEYQRLRLQIVRKYEGLGGNSGELAQARREATQQAIKQAQAMQPEERSSRSTGGNDSYGLAALGASISEFARYQDLYRNLERLRSADLISQQQYTDALKELDTQRFDHFQNLAAAAFQSAATLLQAVSALMQSERDKEIAQVEEQYSRIDAATAANRASQAAHQEEKQRQIAAIKTKYARREAAMQTAQAIAQTAMNALAAYGSLAKIPIVGPVLGAAAAAAAVAAGAVQIAQIKAQAEAQNRGYYDGGFTGGRNYRRTAGVVHEGEFVANHHAVNNPELSPFFQVLDRAQRTNTVAALRADDVTAALRPDLRNPTPAPAATPTANSSSASNTATPQNSPLLRAITTLNQQLAQGISATVLIDGNDGLHRKYQEYKQINNLK